MGEHKDLTEIELVRLHNSPNNMMAVKFHCESEPSVHFIIAEYALSTNVKVKLILSEDLPLFELTYLDSVYETKTIAFNDLVLIFMVNVEDQEQLAVLRLGAQSRVVGDHLKEALKNYNYAILREVEDAL
jgi:putative Ca2+/H+ antiporter (TMEM165/GDT1 family)